MNTSLPLTYVIGDTFSWVDIFTNYTSSAGYTAKFIFSEGVEVDGVADGDGFEFTITASQFNTPGTVRYTRVVYKDTKRTTIDTGTLEVKADPIDSGDETEESHAVKTFQAVSALIEGRATSDQQSYSIAGRSLTKMTIAELLNFRDYYGSLVKQERAKALRDRGIIASNGSPVYFGRRNAINPFRR